MGIALFMCDRFCERGDCPRKRRDFNDRDRGLGKFFHLMQVDFLAVALHEAILEERKLLIGNYAQSPAVMHLPATLQAPEAFGHEGIYKRMKLQRDAALAKYLRHLLHLAFQSVGKEKGALDYAGAVARRAAFLHLYFHRRAYALTRNLHEAEFRERQYGVLGTVALHILAHALVEGLAVLGLGHVYKVHDDYAAHIAKTQLARQFIGGSEVHVESVEFLFVVLL